MQRFNCQAPHNGNYRGSNGYIGGSKVAHLMEVMQLHHQTGENRGINVVISPSELPGFCLLD